MGYGITGVTRAGAQRVVSDTEMDQQIYQLQEQKRKEDEARIAQAKRDYAALLGATQNMTPQDAERYRGLAGGYAQAAGMNPNAVALGSNSVWDKELYEFSAHPWQSREQYEFARDAFNREAPPTHQVTKAWEEIAPKYGIEDVARYGEQNLGLMSGLIGQPAGSDAAYLDSQAPTGKMTSAVPTGNDIYGPLVPQPETASRRSLLVGKTDRSTLQKSFDAALKATQWAIEHGGDVQGAYYTLADLGAQLGYQDAYIRSLLTSKPATVYQSTKLEADNKYRGDTLAFNKDKERTRGQWHQDALNYQDKVLRLRQEALNATGGRFSQGLKVRLATTKAELASKISKIKGDLAYYDGLPDSDAKKAPGLAGAMADAQSLTILQNSLDAIESMDGGGTGGGQSVLKSGKNYGLGAADLTSAIAEVKNALANDVRPGIIGPKFRQLAKQLGATDPEGLFRDVMKTLGR